LNTLESASLVASLLVAEDTVESEQGKQSGVWVVSLDASDAHEWWLTVNGERHKVSPSMVRMLLKESGYLREEESPEQAALRHAMLRSHKIQA